jgi:hypothetical protein
LNFELENLPKNKTKKQQSIDLHQTNIKKTSKTHQMSVLSRAWGDIRTFLVLLIVVFCGFAVSGRDRVFSFLSFFLFKKHKPTNDQNKKNKTEASIIVLANVYSFIFINICK